MRTFRGTIAISALVVGLGLIAMPVLSLETGSMTQVDPDSEGPDPNALFSEAFRAYARGDKAESLEIYRSAAELGHIGALWKIGRMYETGDGIDADRHKAYLAYREMARRHGDIPPNDRDSVYVSSAFVTLAGMLRDGVEGQVDADPFAARRVYFYAASYFGEREAQYELGRMLQLGEQSPGNSRQAARWLKLASDKGHIGAMALLGQMLYAGDGIESQPVVGLAMLIRARELASGDDASWINELYEGVNGEADHKVRADATALAAKLAQTED